MINPSPPAVPPLFYWLETALSTAGAAIAGTLWWAHRANVELPCTGDGRGCDLVNASHWAHVTVGPWHDIPLALLGLVSYVALLTLAMMKLGADTERARRWLHVPFWTLSLFGASYSVYLQYVAHFRIGAFCVWCFSSATIMLLLFASATWEAAWRARTTRPVDIPGTHSETRPISHV